MLGKAEETTNGICQTNIKWAWLRLNRDYRKTDQLNKYLHHNRTNETT